MYWMSKHPKDQNCEAETKIQENAYRKLDNCRRKIYSLIFLHIRELKQMLYGRMGGWNETLNTLLPKGGNNPSLGGFRATPKFKKCHKILKISSKFKYFYKMETPKLISIPKKFMNPLS
jgi:hypothetical protein